MEIDRIIRYLDYIEGKKNVCMYFCNGCGI